VERLGIPESVLPEVRPSAEPLGGLSAERAAALGLPESVRVCSPVSDNQASVVGAAGFGEGSCVVNLGTGGQVSIPSREFTFVPGLETRPMPFGGYILVGASLCGGWSYAYLRRFCQDMAREMTGRDVTDAEAYERLNALAASAPPGAGGLTADTRFDGTRGEPDVRGAFTGIDASNLTPANLARAVVEGMAQELANMADVPARAAVRQAHDGTVLSLPKGRARIARVVASGNAARNNPLVRQAIEQAFGAPCSVGPAREEAALGAAYCAAVGLGLLSTEEVNAAVAAGR
jgi:sugar (pentulose or hexulose) kinase